MISLASSVRRSLGRFAMFGALALVVLAFGGIPASVALRQIVFERSAPPIPEKTPDRDTSLTLVAKTESGAAVHRADVRVFSILSDPASPGAPARAYLAARGRTDEAGRATFGGLPRGEAWILADSGGLARASSHRILEPGMRDVELVLGTPHRLAVDVKDDRGAPIAAAEIEVASGDPLPIGARADDAGVAHVARLPPGPWVVTVRAAGFEEVAYRGVKEGEPLHATLRKLGAIVVHVLDGERPVAGARVEITSATLWPARAAETTKDGSVRASGLSAGTYALRAVHQGRVSPIEFALTLARGEEKSVTLHLAPGVMIALRVTEGDADDAEPIRGARVTLTEGGISPFPIEGTTDREGRARLGPIARGPASVAARADGFVPRGAIAVPDDVSGEMRVALARAGVLEGRVVDTRGMGIDGATIEVIGTDFYGAPIADDPRRAGFRDAAFAHSLAGPRPLIPAGDLGVMPGPVPPIPHGQSMIAVLPAADPHAAPPDVTEPWVTREDGSFRAAPASPGRVRALVRHPQYVEAWSDVVTLAPGGHAEVTVTMHAGGTLEGQVEDASGHGAAGLRVTMAAARGAMERTTRTASDGTFAFAAVPEAVTLLVSPEDDPTQIQARAVVHVPEGEKKAVTITLAPSRPALAVTVRDDRAYPIELAQITAVSLDPASPLRTTAYTDARGEADVVSARGLALRLEVRAPGHATAVLTPDPSAASVDIVLPPASIARGEVRAARNGAPVVDADVTLYEPSGARHTRTGADGAFTFDDLGPGSARITLRARGFAPITRDVTIAAHGDRRPTELPRIELAEGGAIDGVVIDPRGDPVPGARVAVDHVPTYLVVGGTPAGVAVCDAKGRFHLGDLAEGAATLEAYAPDVGRAREPGVVVDAGRTRTGVRIVLREGDEKTREPAAAGGVAVTLGETGEPREVVVVSVVEASEAERAGLAPGDVLVDVGGAPVHAIEDARARLGGALGDDVLVTLRRGDRTQTLRIAREQIRR